MPTLHRSSCQIGTRLTFPAPGARALAAPPGSDWERLLAQLPADLEASARASGAIKRVRAVPSAGELLRLVLLYAQADWSLRLVAVWAELQGVSRLSHVALLHRLQGTEAWLQSLVTAQVGVAGAAGRLPTGRVRLADATALSRPGSRGTDWRVHLTVDLGRGAIDGVAVTDVRGGETLGRYAVEPGDIVVADAGYSHPRGLAHVAAAQAWSVVRWAWQTLPLRTPRGRPWEPWAWLRTLPPGGVGAQPAQVRTPTGPLAVRLVALRLPQATADRARARVRRQARKKGRVPSARSRTLAGYILLVTTLPAAQWDAAAVLALYRVRWQVEVVFKRLKSLWHLDAVRARQPRLGTVYLWGTLLAALLAVPAVATLPAAVATWFRAVERPVSGWRWEQLWREVLGATVRGAISQAHVLAHLARLQRHLCDGPRRRRQQATAARAALGPTRATVRCRGRPAARRLTQARA